MSLDIEAEIDELEETIDLVEERIKDILGEDVDVSLETKD